MQKIKDAAPKTVTIGGGLMYTAVPQKIMTDNPQLDYAIVGVFGDNEYPLCELLGELKKPAPKFADIRGLTWRKDGEIVLTRGPMIQKSRRVHMQIVSLDGHVLRPSLIRTQSKRNVTGAKRCHFATSGGGGSE